MYQLLNKEFSSSLVLSILLMAAIPVLITLTRKYAFSLVKFFASYFIITLVIPDETARAGLRSKSDDFVYAFHDWFNKNVTKGSYRRRIVQFSDGQKVFTQPNNRPIWFKYKGVYGRFSTNSVSKLDLGTGIREHEISFFTRDEEFIEMVLNEIYEDDNKTNSVFDYRSGPGPSKESWVRTGHCNVNHHLFLEKKIKEVVDRAVDKFKNNRDWYTKNGVPWKMTFLFHGLPGVGKSSMVVYLSKMLQFPVYRVNLEQVPMGRLASMMESIPPGSILAIEDFDDTAGMGKRTETPDTKEKVRGKLNEFLNVFSGIVEIRGIVTVLTTNHIDMLDPAIFRPGRVDYLLELKPMDFQQLEEFYEHHFGGKLDMDPSQYRELPAAAVFQIAEYCHFEDAELFKKMVTYTPPPVEEKTPPIIP